MNTSIHSTADQDAYLDRLRATLAFDEPVTKVAQVSSARAQLLYRAFGVKTIRNLVNVFPRRYIDMSQVVTIGQAELGKQYTIVGEVYDIKQKRPRPSLSLVEWSLTDDTGILVVTAFNQPWLINSLKKGMRVSVSGKVEFSYGYKRMTNPFLVIHEATEETEGVVLPVHPATSNLSRALMRRLVSNALDVVQGMYDPLPLGLRSRYRLYSRYQAYRGIHQPFSMEDVHQAKRRLCYEELLFLELELLEQEQKRIEGCTPFVHVANGKQVKVLRDSVPFELTEDQAQAIEHITSLMALPKPMNHLLLGDVGTGKTLVAAFALVLCADSGTQAMMMGPTEVLVRQYGTSLGPLLDQLGIPWAILTGSTSDVERRDILSRFSQGSLCVLFGTHALLEDDVVPQCCSLVCIDEQQRFGVEQREALIAKAPGADILSMTATPIPRSLALALYGGLTLSYLHTAPALQKGRTTEVCHFSEEGIAYDALREALDRGEQAYVICPLIGLDLSEGVDKQAHDDDTVSHIEYAAIEWGIEHDDVGDTLSAATLHAKMLKEQIVPQARVELLHGKLSSEEKNFIMNAFRAGKVDVLVSTTVVEVGVDVPNATIMIIEDADRFGLAQLHQLRGRVGRGSLPGQVFLISRSKSPQSLERLKIMEQVDDGYTLSEYDLSLRQEGDIFGSRQHGHSRLAFVNVVRDKAIIEAAYNDARECMAGSLLSDTEQRLLMQELKRIQKARVS